MQKRNEEHFAQAVLDSDKQERKRKFSLCKGFFLNPFTLKLHGMVAVQQNADMKKINNLRLRLIACNEQKNAELGEKE